MSRLEPDFRQTSELSIEDVSAIISVGRRQAEIMNQLEEALIADDVAGRRPGAAAGRPGTGSETAAVRGGLKGARRVAAAGIPLGRDEHAA
jgi:hypothetical protein